MNFIRNRNFRAGPQTSLEGFICPQNSDKQQKIKVFGRSEGEAMVETPTISLHKGKDAQKRAYQTTIIVVETENALDAMGKVIIQIIRMEKRKIIFAQPAMELNNVQLAIEKDSDKKEKVTPLLVF